MNVDSPFHGARQVWLTQFKSICESDVWRVPGMKGGTGTCGVAVQETVSITDFFVRGVGQLASEHTIFYFATNSSCVNG